jgi:O-antigen/teichoic acid export membrane protein
MITAVTFPFLVRRLGVDMYGLWSYVVALVALLDNVANPGLTGHAEQQVAARRGEASDVVSDTLVLRFLFSLLMIAVIVGISWYETRPDVARLLLVFGILKAFTNLTSSPGLLASMELFHARAGLMLTQQALYAVGVLAFVRSPGDVMWVPVSILLSAFFTNLYGWVLLHRAGLRLSLGIHQDRWLAILKPSGHYAGASWMSSIYHRSGHIIIRWVLGEHALGVYAAATRLVDFLRQMLVVSQSVMMPRTAKVAGSAPTLRRIVRFSLVMQWLLGFPMVIALLGTASVIVPLVLGAQYMESAQLLPWLAPYVVVAPAAVLFCGTVLYALGDYRSYLISTTTGAVAALLLYLVLVPLMGLRGACLAFVAGELAVAVSAYRLSPPAAREVWTHPLLYAVAGAAAVMGMIVGVASHFLRPVPATILAGVVYLLICGLLARRRIVQEFRTAQ